MEKNYEVYDAFQPWMIGEKVEVGVYTRDPESTDETNEIVNTSGGTLLTYMVNHVDESVEVLFVSYTANPSYLGIPASHLYIISVVEPRT